MRVYSYQDKNICGAIGHMSLNEDIVFSNSLQMLFAIEEILDSIQFPQHNLETRSFKNNDDNIITTLSADSGEDNPIATFHLKVLFRQNASWQGSLAWLEEKSDVQFRSVFELLQLLDSVLS